MYISNGRVAWRIPDEFTGMYRAGLYRPPEGWNVVSNASLIGWVLGNGGVLHNPAVLRRKKSGKARKSTAGRR